MSLFFLKNCKFTLLKAENMRLKLLGGKAGDYLNFNFWQMIVNECNK